MKNQRLSTTVSFHSHYEACWWQHHAMELLLFSWDWENFQSIFVQNLQKFSKLKSKLKWNKKTINVLKLPSHSPDLNSIKKCGQACRGMYTQRYRCVRVIYYTQSVSFFKLKFSLKMFLFVFELSCLFALRFHWLHCRITGRKKDQLHIMFTSQYTAV